jgi:hypothetical protein
MAAAGASASAATAAAPARAAPAAASSSAPSLPPLVPGLTPLPTAAQTVRYSRGELLASFAPSGSPPAPYLVETEGITAAEGAPPLGANAASAQRRECARSAGASERMRA